MSNSYNINLNKLKKMEESLSNKLHIAKVKAYSTSIASSVILVVGTEFTKNVTIKVVNGIDNINTAVLKSSDIVLVGSLLTVGGIGLATSIVYTIPKYLKLKKQKKKLLEQKEQILKKYYSKNNVKSNNATNSNKTSNNETHNTSKMLDDFIKENSIKKEEVKTYTKRM